jgi:hypothetical protein
MTETTDTMREMDHRHSDGIDVRMLWDSADDRVIVTVSDAKTGEALELTVAPHENALDVFHHPYAYAAHRGVEPRPVRAVTA